MKILYPIAPGENGADFMFWCPGCKCGHGVWTTARKGNNCLWSFNGNLDKPTLSPSLLVRYIKEPPQDPVTGDFERDANGKYKLGPDGRIAGIKDCVCHSFIRDGQIQFLTDCTHALAGKTVPMEAF
jgi:hypothetical protein